MDFAKSIRAAFALTAFIILTSTLLTYFYGRHVTEAQNAAAARHRLLADSELLISTVKDAETGERGFVLTGDENYLQPYNDAVARLPQQLAALDRPDDPRLGDEEMARIRSLTERILAELQNSIELRRSNGLEPAVAALANGVQKQMMEELRGVIVKLQTREEITMRAETHAVDRMKRRTSGIFISCGLASLLCLGWTYRRLAAFSAGWRALPVDK